MDRLRTTVLCTAILAMAAFGCSSSKSATTTPTSSGTSTSVTYPAGKEKVCKARDNLKSSLAALTNPSLLTQGKSGIKSAVDKVQSDLTALANAGKGDYKPQIDALRTSLNQLQTAVGNLGNGNAAQNLQAVTTQISNVATTAKDLLSKLQADCRS
jgi:hypothetical protein